MTMVSNWLQSINCRFGNSARLARLSGRSVQRDERSRARVGRVPLSMLAIWVLLLAFDAYAVRFDGVNIKTQAQSTEVTLAFDRAVEFNYFTLDGPDRLVVDLSDAESTFNPNQIKLPESVIQQVRLGRQKGGVLRAVFDLKEPVILQHIKAGNAASQQRIEFHLRPLTTAMQGTVPTRQKKLPQKKIIAAPESQQPPQQEVASERRSDEERVATLPTNRDVIVVIDPGHGGKDPGAVGPSGVLEKHIVLQISKKIAAELNQKQGFKAILTRDKDIYIPLAKRRELARDVHNADLFVSVHADSWTRRSARGASVYALSRRGASSALARHLAAHQRAYEPKTAQSDLKSVLADLAMEGSLEHSFKVGDYVLDELGDVTRLHKRQVERAAFAVLKSPDLPSILVETGFISNPKEEQRLQTRHFQKKVATAIGDGLERYFIRQSPPGTWLANQGQKRRGKHKIVRGETLSTIAAKYRVSQRDIRLLNNINSDIIRVGDVLVIPQGDS